MVQSDKEAPTSLPVPSKNIASPVLGTWTGLGTEPQEAVNNRRFQCRSRLPLDALVLSADSLFLGIKLSQTATVDRGGKRMLTMFVPPG